MKWWAWLLIGAAIARPKEALAISVGAVQILSSPEMEALARAYALQQGGIS